MRRTGRLDESCPTSSSSPRSSRPATSRRRSSASATASPRACTTRPCSARRAPARPRPSPGRSPTHNKPTLVLAHNKTLAAQLYAEFREFFPENAVEYFVSYFDYYQPEAYLPRSDTYIEKDSSRNDEIDRLRHAATHALFERRDVIIVASVSLHLRPRRAGRLRRDRPQAAGRRPVPARRRPAPPRRPPVPAQRPGAAAGPGSASAATPSSSSRPPRRPSSASSSSATRSSGSPSSTR